MNDDMPMCERHEANYIQSEELNNDVKNDLEDFKRRIRSMRTVHWKLFSRDDVYLGNMEGNGLEEYGNGKGWGGKSDDSLKNQKVPPPPIIVNNKSKKD
ncbi:hypothetical protein Tco_1509157 [Tanacetum coccineum]